MTAASQISLLAQHPLSAAFPAMPEDDLQALAEDIAKHGQRDKGVLLEGMVLDGWHRYLACHRIGVQFKAKDFDGDDPVAFVLSRNLHRRHLTASQRAAAVVSATNWRPAGVRNGMAEAASTMTEKQMADAAEVTTRTIRQAKVAQAAGLGDEVKAGTMSAERAAAVAKLPKAKRAKAVKAIKDGEAPKPEKKPSAEKLQRELIDLQGKYADLLEKNTDLADTARELNDKLTMFETIEPDEQQKEIAKLQKALQRKDGEIMRQRGQISDLNNKCNALIRQVKSLQKKG